MATGTNPLDPQAVQAGVEAGIDIFNTAHLHSQLFWTGLSFFIMLGILWWKVLPAITKMLDERAAKIGGDIKGAETARMDAEKALAKYEAKLAKAKDEATAILSTARADAKAMIDSKLAEAEAEITKKKEDAKQSISAAKTQAMKELEGTVTNLAIKITETLLQETVDSKKAQKLTDAAVKELTH